MQSAIAEGTRPSLLLSVSHTAAAAPTDHETSVALCSCGRIHHPRINAAVDAIRKAIRGLKVDPYREDSNAGALRYVQLTVANINRESGQHDSTAAVQV